MTHHATNLVAAALTLILLGANLAFLLSVGLRLVGWFRLKIGAVMALLVYVLLSLVFGHPSPFRLGVSGFALLLDIGALGYLWYSVGQASTQFGFIPLQITGKIQVPVDKIAEIDENLKTIHTLVNSNLDAARAGEVEALEERLATLNELVALRQSMGQDPSAETLATIASVQARIAAGKERARKTPDT